MSVCVVGSQQAQQFLEWPPGTNLSGRAEVDGEDVEQTK